MSATEAGPILAALRADVNALAMTLVAMQRELDALREAVVRAEKGARRRPERSTISGRHGELCVGGCGRPAAYNNKNGLCVSCRVKARSERDAAEKRESRAAVRPESCDRGCGRTPHTGLCVGQKIRREPRAACTARLDPTKRTPSPEKSTSHDQPVEPISGPNEPQSAQVVDQRPTTCSRGCGQPTHRGSCPGERKAAPPPPKLIAKDPAKDAHALRRARLGLACDELAKRGHYRRSATSALTLHMDAEKLYEVEELVALGEKVLGAKRAAKVDPKDYPRRDPTLPSEELLAQVARAAEAHPVLHALAREAPRATPTPNPFKAHVRRSASGEYELIAGGQVVERCRTGTTEAEARAKALGWCPAKAPAFRVKV